MTTPKPEPPRPRLGEDVTPAGGSARRVVALAALMFAGFSFVTVEIAPVGLLPAISADLDVSLPWGCW
jgi:predicted MFS family arabinose efflux permease